MYTAESTNVACVVVRVKDFFKCGINTGFRLLEKPHKKNSEVIKAKAKPVLVVSVADVFGGRAVFIAITSWFVFVAARPFQFLLVAVNNAFKYKLTELLSGKVSVKHGG